MLTEKQKETILATVPVLRENGVVLTKHFYNRMLRNHPELKNIFNLGNQNNERQQTALAMAVLAYAENITNPDVLIPVIDMIGHKHTSLDIKPEHYSIVGENLIAAISEVLQEAATNDIIDAWTIAYKQLADLMIGHEKGLYNKKFTEENGWVGWKSFMIKKKVRESEEITSFYLYPIEGEGVPLHVPGQYLSIRLFLPQLGLLQPRQYSISCAPNGKYYRISVKRELGGELHPDGMISNRLHQMEEGELVELTSPSGNFVLNTNDNDKVFISGGVGQTPLLAMLESLTNTSLNHNLVWIHGCRHSGVHAFEEAVKKVENNVANVSSHIFYEEAVNTSADYYTGRVDLSKIKGWLPDVQTEYYICGPAGFIKAHYNYLKECNVPVDKIFFEEFGPQVLQLN
ncbi:NO-inducible flavohemoprotein [Flavobacterium beibuense]|uniref:Flavohemoprotein n=1 Tax=Flavobacterium beibuense TaxID=657326 RepID=A0A444W3B1_9FLAO|nr:NO-inducible flavohemoprotein [Flavobacterium beibuense]RYJ40409.1 globin [Flavobacterium beibuense]